MPRYPKQFRKIRDKFKKLHTAVADVGKAARKAGPLDAKTSHLIQMAAAASIRSEGSVHSHARRALDAGATPDELYHTIVLLTSTIGFPTVSAALTWVEDVLPEE